MDFLDLKNYYFRLYFPKMSKVTVFYLIPSNFFVDLFLGMLIFFSHTPNKNPPAYYLFDFLDLITDFLDFLDLKTDF